MCKCKVCGKEFKYGDENSPMLKNEVWGDVVRHYELQDYEENAYNAYKKVNFGFGRKRFVDKDEYHLYICTNCMEKALGRKILKEDLMGKDVPFNADFEEKYFK